VFVSEEATILHADADAFFAAVEQRDDPELRGKPVIVGPGVVMAASYEARAFGVRGAMGGAQARRLCPQAIFVSPRFDAYVDASRELFELFRETAPIVEGVSLEEAFLDVRGLERICGTPREIAVRLRARARRDVGLALSVGIARTKVVAKMASAAAKPDGLLVIEPGREREFLDPLEVEALWGVGRKTARKLRARGIERVRQVAAADLETLTAMLGRSAGHHLHAISRGRDRRRVRAGRRRGSYGSQSARARSRSSRAELDAVLCALVDRVTRRMRRAGRAGRTVILRLRFDDFSRATRSRTLPHPSGETEPILAAALSLLDAAEPTIKRRGLTLLGITVANLSSSAMGLQLRLPLDRDRAALDAALDDLRERFGPDAVIRATLVDGPADLATSVLAGEKKGKPWSG
jgi:DNA polymerase IV